uniref:Large ribosomal subunit protein uL4c n=1 Tax=Schimmelmannia schousboei TaxID=173468 RepID=A0A1C9C938_9FLOR|nr:ribosomal protein L4 [Schimmelmannia schousboei]AOM64882.1 ribosomal protein L4 [Schimmelmannia schousboei]
MVKQEKLTYSVITENEESQYSKDIFLKINDNHAKNMYIIHRALIQQLLLTRQGNAHTKTRSEVRGGGRKPWKQKGTGRARVGSIRSPLWKGGGVIFGPKSKKYITKINRKEKKLAVKTLIYNKYKNTFIIENLGQNIIQPKTKFILNEIQQLNINYEKKNKLLIIVNQKNSLLYLSLRNLQNIELIAANQINILSLIKADKILITLDALNTINAIYNGK